MMKVICAKMAAVLLFCGILFGCADNGNGRSEDAGQTQFPSNGNTGSSDIGENVMDKKFFCKKSHILKMLELYRFKSCDVDVWHDRRFLEKWAGDEILEDLKTCFAHYDEEDVRNALVSTHKLFEKISERLAAIERFEYPAQTKNCAKAYLGI